jgi:hypothetical protein
MGNVCGNRKKEFSRGGSRSTDIQVGKDANKMESLKDQVLLSQNLPRIGENDQEIKV